MSASGYLLWLETEGYRDARLIGPQRWAGIQRLMFTHRIAVGTVGDFDGIDDGWCYHDYPSAKRALDAWDGSGEPQGWHRHPFTGRRRAESGDERDATGRRVSIGTIYTAL